MRSHKPERGEGGNCERHPARSAETVESATPGIAQWCRSPTDPIGEPVNRRFHSSVYRPLPGTASSVRRVIGLLLLLRRLLRDSLMARSRCSEAACKCSSEIRRWLPADTQSPFLLRNIAKQHQDRYVFLGRKRASREMTFENMQLTCSRLISP